MNKEKIRKRLPIVLTFIIIAGASIFVYFGYREPKVTISPASFNVNTFSSWNITIPIEEIANIDTISWNEMPRISFRSNGISLFGVHRGWFKTKDGNTIWLSIKSGVTPVIQIAEKNGQLYYMNRTNTKETLDIFNKLSCLMENKE